MHWLFKYNTAIVTDIQRLRQKNSLAIESTPIEVDGPAWKSGLQT